MKRFLFQASLPSSSLRWRTLPEKVARERGLGWTVADHGVLFAVSSAAASEPSQWEGDVVLLRQSFVGQQLAGSFSTDGRNSVHCCLHA